MLFRSHFRRGEYHYRMHNFDISRSELNIAKSLYHSLKDSIMYVESLIQLGMLYDHAGVYVDALDYYISALDLAQTMNDSISIPPILNNIAIIYKKQGNLETADEYYQKSRQLSEDLGDSISVAVGDVNIGLLKKDLGLLDEAQDLFKRTYKFFSAKNNIYAQAVVLHNLGVVQLEMASIDSAIYYFNKSLELADRINHKKTLVKDHIFLGKSYLKKPDYEMALFHGHEAINVISDGKMAEELESAHYLLFSTYKNIGNPFLALHHFEKYVAVKDSLLNKSTQQDLNRMRTEYEVKQKDQEIASLKKSKELQENLVEAEILNNRLLLISIVVMGILLGVLIYAYMRGIQYNKKLKNQTYLLAEQKEEITAARESLMEKNQLLEQINQHKDEIIGVVAHDLRSPLNQIKGLLNLIGDLHDEKEKERFIKLGLQSTDLLRNRINRMLDLEALNAGKVDVKMEIVEPNELVNELINNYLESAKTKNIQLNYENNAPECRPMADRNYLLQVLENLLSNAIKYSPEDTHILISTYINKSKFVFAVQDEGPGISEEEIKLLFQKYTKLKARPTANEDSTGLGLSIVKKYVEAMNGEVWCESEEGTGATFFIALKNYQASDDQPRESEALPQNIKM